MFGQSLRTGTRVLVLGGIVRGSKEQLRHRDGFDTTREVTRLPNINLNESDVCRVSGTYLYLLCCIHTTDQSTLPHHKTGSYALEYFSLNSPS